MTVNSKIVIQRDTAIPKDLTIVEAIVSKVFFPETPSDIIMMIKRDTLVFNCNISAGIVLEGIQQNKSIAEICRDFQKVFIDIQDEQIKYDIEVCINDFLQKGLLLLDE